jgi:predicted component of type VI protein secretion system
MTDGSRLVMSQGPQPGHTFMLDQDFITLGRDPSNDIVISDPQVSRQHARIRRQGNVVMIEDAGSTNGTFVNGMRLIGPHTLVDGDAISLGDAATLVYHGADVTMTKPLAGRPTIPPAAPTYRPQPAPAPPPPVYTAAPPSAAEPVEEEKRKTWLWVAWGCLGLILACIAVGLVVWYAPASFWQALIDLGIPVPAWPF